MAELRIDQVCSIVVDCEHKTVPEDLYGSAWAVGTPAMTDGRIDFSRAKRISDDTYDLWTRRAVPVEGDLILAREAPVGPVVRVPASPKVALGQRTVLLRPRPDVIDSRYLHFLLMSSDMQHQMHSKSEGSTVRHLNVEDVRALPLPPLPLLLEQRAIACVLGALDDKIESNRRLAKTAIELCDQTFLSATDVDFQISEVGQVTMGSSPPGDTYNTDGVGTPFYQGVTDFGFLSPTRRVWTTSPIREAKVGETLVSVRAPVGRLNEASEQSCIGRGVAAISSSFQTTLFYALRQADAVWAQFEGEGTVFGSINKGDLERARIPWISPDRISELEVELMDVHECVRASVRELQCLTSLRDVLLPELLSGRLRVKDAESMMENM